MTANNLRSNKCGLAFSTDDGKAGFTPDAYILALAASVFNAIGFIERLDMSRFSTRGL